MRRRRTFAAGARLVLSLAVASCASGQSADEDPFSGTRSDDPVLITIQNDDFRDATIYAYWNGVKHRVGMVVGKTSDTFTMQWRGERLQLEVDFVGRGGVRMESIDAWPGDHIHFVILPGM